MIYLISSALAEEPAAQAAQQGAPSYTMLILVGIMFVGMYFLMIRPQQKRAKEHKAMLESLNRGAEVVTSGGVAGRIVEVKDGFAKLEIAENTVITVQKQAIVTVLPKSTLKNI